MSAFPMTIELLMVFVTTVFLLHKYGNWRRQHVIVSVSVLIGWFFAFIIVFILPLDVALAFYRDCILRHDIVISSSTIIHSKPISISTTLNPGSFHDENSSASEPQKNNNKGQGMVQVDYSSNNEDKFQEHPKNVRKRDFENFHKAREFETLVQKREADTNTNPSPNGSWTTAEPMTSTASPASRSFCSEPGSYVPEEVLINLWRVVYWTSQALTWLILPIMQSYSSAGDFTVLGKIRTALYENIIYYGSYLLILSLLLIYAAVKGIDLSWLHIKIIAITASNTWGLFLLVLLLGYGLVEIPRQLWNFGNKGMRLQKTYFDLEKHSADKNDAEEAVREAYRDAQAALDSLREGNPYRTKAESIMDKFPPEIKQQLNRRVSGSSGRESFRDTDAANLTSTTEKSLVRLHKRVIDALQSHHRTQAQWKALVAQALHLEEVMKNEAAPPGSAKEFVRSYRTNRSAIEQAVCSPSIEWWWECRIKRPLLKVIAAVLGLMTGLVVWSECTFFVKSPVLSLAARFVYLAAYNYDYGYIQVSSILVISYLCVCAYYTVFKLKIYRYYHLDPHHETDENSLLFSAILMCRLTPPLCLNFLGMIHLDSHVVGNTKSETAFTTIMGHMDLLPVVHHGFNIYFPILILLLCLGTYFRLGTRCLHQLGIDQFVGDDEMTIEMVQGGKALVQTERNRMQRDLNRESRHDYLDERKKQDSTRPLRRTLGGGDRDRTEYNNQDGRGFSDYGGYSDTVPIVPEMEEGEGPNSSGSFRFEDENLRLDSNPANRSSSQWGRGYGSPNSPPKGIFDDL